MTLLREGPGQGGVGAPVQRLLVRHEDDVFTWACQQTALLRAGRLEALNREHLAALRAGIVEAAEDAYASARYEALIETDLPEVAIPTSNPDDWDEIMLREIAWPEA